MLLRRSLASVDRSKPTWRKWTPTTEDKGQGTSFFGDSGWMDELDEQGAAAISFQTCACLEPPRFDPKTQKKNPSAKIVRAVQ